MVGTNQAQQVVALAFSSDPSIGNNEDQLLNLSGNGEWMPLSWRVAMVTFGGTWHNMFSANASLPWDSVDLDQAMKVVPWAGQDIWWQDL